MVVLFFYGGFDPQKKIRTAEAWKFNLVTRSWTRLADMPVALEGAAAAVLGGLPNGPYVALFGGIQPDGGFNNRTFLFKP